MAKSQEFAGPEDVGVRTDSGDVVRKSDGSASKKKEHKMGKQSIFEGRAAEKKVHSPIELNGTFYEEEVTKHEVEEIMAQVERNFRKDDDLGDAYYKHAIRIFLRCAAAGNIQAVSAFLKNQMSPVATYTKHGGTALHHAAHKNKEDILDVCISALGNTFERTEAVNRRDEWGRTPLHIAAKNGFTELVVKLVEKSAKLEAVDDFQMHTPLTLAAMNGHTTTVRKLLELGASRDARTVKGESAYDLLKAKNPTSSILNQLAPDNQKDLDNQRSVLDRDAMLKRRAKMTKSLDYCGAWVSDEDFVLQVNVPGLNRNSFATENLRYERIGTGIRLTGNLDIGFTPDLAGWSEADIASGKYKNYMSYEHRWEQSEFDATFPLPESVEWKPQFIEIKNGRIGFRFRNAGEYRQTEAEMLMDSFAIGAKSPEKKKRGGSGILSDSLPDVQGDKSPDKSDGRDLMNFVTNMKPQGPFRDK